jgi:hypothetical protein
MNQNGTTDTKGKYVEKMTETMHCYVVRTLNDLS